VLSEEDGFLVLMLGMVVAVCESPYLVHLIPYSTLVPYRDSTTSRWTDWWELSKLNSALVESCRAGAIVD
jgi:hypothetical protein